MKSQGKCFLYSAYEHSFKHALLKSHIGLMCKHAGNQTKWSDSLPNQTHSELSPEGLTPAGVHN